VKMIGEHLERFDAPQGYLFSSAQGGPVRHHNFKVRHFNPAVRRASEDPALGIPAGLRFHDLRHTCAAILIGQGWNPKQIQTRLRHASIRTTLDRYGHVFDGHDTELLERLDAIHRAMG
jgi:integrase